jgi:hypothetical protein
MESAAPSRVREYAQQAVEYVRRAVGIALEYDSDTLPLLDHYLRSVAEVAGAEPARAAADDLGGGASGARGPASAAQAATLQLVVVTAGAYFGEVVRLRLGGRWELAPSAARGPAAETGDASDRGEEGDTRWRVVLPTGLNFAPAGLVAAAIAQADLEDLDSELDAPPRMRPHLQRALERMGEVSADDYYSLCGRLDTIEHLHEVLVAVAAQMLGDADDPDAADEVSDGGDAPPGAIARAADPGDPDGSSDDGERGGGDERGGDEGGGEGGDEGGDDPGDRDESGRPVN